MTKNSFLLKRLRAAALVSAAVVSVALASAETASAGEPLNADQLSMLVTGNTLYVELPEGAPGAPDGGTAPIFYGLDGNAAAQLPDGPKLVGVWALRGDRACVDWRNGPKNSCTRYERGSDAFVALDAARNAPRGAVRRVAVGNPENL